MEIKLMRNSENRMEKLIGTDLKNADMTIMAIANTRKSVNTIILDKFVTDSFRMENVKMEALVD